MRRIVGGHLNRRAIVYGAIDGAGRRCCEGDGTVKRLRVNLNAIDDVTRQLSGFDAKKGIAIGIQSPQLQAGGTKNADGHDQYGD